MAKFSVSPRSRGKGTSALVSVPFLTGQSTIGRVSMTNTSMCWRGKKVDKILLKHLTAQNLSQ